MAPQSPPASPNGNGLSTEEVERYARSALASFFDRPATDEGLVGASLELVRRDAHYLWDEVAFAGIGFCVFYPSLSGPGAPSCRHPIAAVLPWREYVELAQLRARVRSLTGGAQPPT